MLYLLDEFSYSIRFLFLSSELNVSYAAPGDTIKWTVLIQENVAPNLQVCLARYALFATWIQLFNLFLILDESSESIWFICHTR